MPLALAFVVLALALLTGVERVYAAPTTVPISDKLATSIAADLFPVTVKLDQGNLFLTNPAVLFLGQERIGMQVRFQAYDYRPEQNVAISETGEATISGKIGYDLGTRQVLLYDPRIDRLAFDQKNAATQGFSDTIKAAWRAQVTNPLRAALPPHPYLLPFRNNIQSLSYDGTAINLTLSYE
ncbi:MAG: hypothetical protein R3E50_17170 [Halioglobus sp.]